MEPYQATVYSKKEERFNIISHALGFILSIVALALLLLKTGDAEHETFISSTIYGLSLIILYAASTLYHSSTVPKLRNRFNIFDHAAIYVLIAGTYTPFCLITLAGSSGNLLLLAIWTFAILGVVIKLFFTGRYDRLSTWMYVLMGWMAVFAIRPMIANLPVEGLWWLLMGGISYSIGAILYSIPHRVTYNHAIFHVLVLLGSFCHFVSVYFYVLP